MSQTGKNFSYFWLHALVEIILRFSVGFGTLMRKWEIFPEHSFFTVFRNCSRIFFLNSQRFPHHFLDFFWFSNNTVTFRKAKNYNIWDFSKALIFQIFSECLEGFFEFFRFSQNCLVLPGRNISQIFLEIFLDFLRNFFRISQKFVLKFSQIFCRFWDIDEKVGDFSEVGDFLKFFGIAPQFFFLIFWVFSIFK